MKGLFVCTIIPTPIGSLCIDSLISAQVALPACNYLEKSFTTFSLEPLLKFHSSTHKSSTQIFPPSDHPFDNMSDTEEIVLRRKLNLCPTISDWPISRLLTVCPDCKDFHLYCCTCYNLHPHLPQNARRRGHCHRYCLIFADGACLNNGRPGAKAGIGVAYGESKDSQLSVPIKDDEDGYSVRSNQRAELLAAKLGLEFFAESEDPFGDSKVWIIATDSEYVAKGMTEWLPMWKVRSKRTQS